MEESERNTSAASGAEQPGTVERKGETETSRGERGSRRGIERELLFKVVD